MKANFSINDIIHIQVVSRLSDLLFDELQKIDVQGAPLSVQRIHLKAIENATAILFRFATIRGSFLTLITTEVLGRNG
jgi:hypothetical protein